ncbi:MAG: hypothetical protein RhofKO_23070 [Rhodothermales bacterium]
MPILSRLSFLALCLLLIASGCDSGAEEPDVVLVEVVIPTELKASCSGQEETRSREVNRLGRSGTLMVTTCPDGGLVSAQLSGNFLEEGTSHASKGGSPSHVQIRYPTVSISSFNTCKSRSCSSKTGLDYTDCVEDCLWNAIIIVDTEDEDDDD